MTMTYEVAVVAPTLNAGAELLERARALTVRDNSTLVIAGELLVATAEAVKTIRKHYGPLKETARRAHLDICAAETRDLAVPLEVEALLKREVARYESEQEVARRALQARLEAEARQLEEDARLAEAQRLADVGELDAAEAVLDAPSIAAPVSVPRLTPKISGVALCKTWRCEVVDLRALARAVADGLAPTTYIVANMKPLNSRARSDGSGFAVPGCRAVQETTVAAGGRR